MKRYDKFMFLIFVMSFGLLIAENSTGPVRFQSSDWDRDTTKMYGIIENYNKNGVVSEQEQDEFKSVLAEMEQYVTDIDPKKYNIKAFKEDYLNPYKVWAKYIVVSPEKIQSAKNAEEMKNIYYFVADKIKESLSQFSLTVSTMLEELGVYSIENKQNFYEDLNGAVQTFESRMVSLKIKAGRLYNIYANSTGQSLDLDD